ncbi:MAG: integrase core domain-containing protein, partial [Cytophagales bacterium]|nr:integrase core domain-containing protein [Cytophagales bacterium]
VTIDSEVDSVTIDEYKGDIIVVLEGGGTEAINAKKALEKALEKAQISNELIHHSDRGIQYCSKEYVDLLKSKGIGISMTKGGSPQENAIAERINGILKHELLNTVELKGITNAKKAINKAITIYNGKRPHLSCNMLTPNQAHDYTTNALKPLWKNYKKRKIKHILVHHY